MAVITKLNASNIAKIILRRGFNPRMAKFLYATKSFLNLNIYLLVQLNLNQKVKPNNIEKMGKLFNLSPYLLSPNKLNKAKIINKLKLCLG
jgi:hypothetical protein